MSQQHLGMPIQRNPLKTFFGVKERKGVKTWTWWNWKHKVFSADFYSVAFWPLIKITDRWTPSDYSTLINSVGIMLCNYNVSLIPTNAENLFGIRSPSERDRRFRAFRLLSDCPLKLHLNIITDRTLRVIGITISIATRIAQSGAPSWGR